MTPTGKTTGQVYLENRGLYTDASWWWISILANFLLLSLYFFVGWIFLTYVEHMPPVNLDDIEGEDSEGPQLQCCWPQSLQKVGDLIVTPALMSAVKV